MEKTEEEKWELLEALYKHGSDVDTLVQQLPSWTRGQITHILSRFRCRAKKKLEEDESSGKGANLNLWYKVIENLHQVQGSTNQPWWRKGRKKRDEEPQDHTPVLSKTLMYAACFEDHYQGSDTDDPNYSEIYRYLAQLVEGKEPTQLSPGSATKVLEMLAKLKEVVSHGSALEHVQHLSNIDISYLSSKENKEGGLSHAGLDLNLPSRSSPLPLCPLFEDEDVKVVYLEPSDPYYEEKREEVIRRMKALQQKEATDLDSIPGLNPMEIPTKLLTKPDVAVLEH